MYSRTWMRTYSGCTSSMSVSFYHLAFWWCGRWWQQKRRRRWRENDDDGSGDEDGDGDDSNIGQRGRAPPSNSVGYREHILSTQHIYSSDKYSKLLSFGTIFWQPKYAQLGWMGEQFKSRYNTCGVCAMCSAFILCSAQAQETSS